MPCELSKISSQGYSRWDRRGILPLLLMLPADGIVLEIGGSTETIKTHESSNIPVLGVSIGWTGFHCLDHHWLGGVGPPVRLRRSAVKKQETCRPQLQRFVRVAHTEKIATISSNLFRTNTGCRLVVHGVSPYSRMCSRSTGYDWAVNTHA
jgi:hypothetical protein